MAVVLFHENYLTIQSGMRAIGNYILRGRLQAIGVISFLTIFSLLFPALAYLMSGVPVALVTLRKGGQIGIQVIAGSLLLSLLLSLLMQISPPVVLVFAISIWLPVWFCALIMRESASHGLLVLSSGVFGMLFIILMYSFMADVNGWWRSSIDVWLQSSFPDGAGDEYLQLFEAAVPLMNAMMASGIVISLILTILIARWWQSLLFNAGAFRKEFYALHLPRALFYPTLIGVILLWLGKDLQQSLLRDLLIVVVFLYLFQGLSTIHRLVSKKGLSHSWLIGLYALLMLMPQMILFMACVGMADSWFGSGKMNS
ncbi:MAG: DUF2232 domain-containing protein [Gammaproteobacteria bacterium]|nr:DUF2232 domain-containing protein [Gammaproteobacteria bacterium]